MSDSLFTCDRIWVNLSHPKLSYLTQPVLVNLEFFVVQLKLIQKKTDKQYFSDLLENKFPANGNVNTGWYVSNCNHTGTCSQWLIFQFFWFFIIRPFYYCYSFQTLLSWSNRKACLWSEFDWCRTEITYRSNGWVISLT